MGQTVSPEISVSTSMCVVVLFQSFHSGSKLKPLTRQYKSPSFRREDLTRAVTWLWLAGSPVTGESAQLVERPLCMREVPGSMPGFSKSFPLFLSSRYSLEKDPILGIACWLVGHI